MYLTSVHGSILEDYFAAGLKYAHEEIMAAAPGYPHGTALISVLQPLSHLTLALSTSLDNAGDLTFIRRSDNSHAAQPRGSHV
jgi:hypothetical protein